MISIVEFFILMVITAVVFFLIGRYVGYQNGVLDLYTGYMDKLYEKEYGRYDDDMEV